MVIYFDVGSLAAIGLGLHYISNEGYLLKSFIW